MVVSACANLQWLGVAVIAVPLATMALVLQAVKPASAVQKGHSVACVKGLVDNAPAELVPLGFAVTAVSVASGDSLAAGRVSAMGMQMSVTPTRVLAWAAVITQGVNTVKGALLVSTETQGCHMGASAGHVPALKALGVSGTLLLPAIGMGTPSKWCVTAGQATQDCGVKLVPLGTLGIHQGQVANANHVSAVGTLIPRTLMPVTPIRGNAYAVYTTQRDLTVPTANLVSMGRLPDRAVTDVPATSWAQIPSSVHPPISATVTEAVGSAPAFPMSRVLAVIAVPLTSGTLPVAEDASPVPATQAEPEAPPAMSSQGSATAVLALVGGPVLSARSSTGETLGCSAVPVIVTLGE